MHLILMLIQEHPYCHSWSLYAVHWIAADPNDRTIRMNYWNGYSNVIRMVDRNELQYIENKEEEETYRSDLNAN